MNGAIAFYCVKCNRLEEAGQASLLFRTGYYRVIHPLGCCVACEADETAVAGLLSDMPGGMDAVTDHPLYGRGSSVAVGSSPSYTR